MLHAMVRAAYATDAALSHIRVHNGAVTVWASQARSGCIRWEGATGEAETKAQKAEVKPCSQQKVSTEEVRLSQITLPKAYVTISFSKVRSTNRSIIKSHPE